MRHTKAEEKPKEEPPKYGRRNYYISGENKEPQTKKDDSNLNKNN